MSNVPPEAGRENMDPGEVSSTEPEGSVQAPDRVDGTVAQLDSAEVEVEPQSAISVSEDASTADPVGASRAESLAEPIVASPVVAAPVTTEPPVQTVYVTAPVPPRKKGNRGFGVLLAVAGAVVFTALFAAIIAVVLATTFGGSIPGNSFALFVSSTGFLVPTVTFLVVFALTAVILNRAGWPAWVIGSLVAAVAVYFGSIGGILLLGNVVGMTPDEANTAYSQLALSAPVVVATILTREVIIWFGLAIAARGRKVKARNVEARADYDRELAENRARYGA